MVHRRKPMRVAALQLPSQKRYQTNFEKLLHYIDAYRDREIIVVPEVFLTAYDYEHLATAAKFSAMALKLLKKEIDSQILVMTLLVEEDGEYFNQAVVIHRHRIVHRQEKVKLFKLGEEDLYLAAGRKKRIKPFEINRVKYAILICFELRFKELWKQIEGADVVFIPARWGKPRKHHLEILSQALAVMNQCYVIVSNSSDEDMASSSAIISPNGDVTMDDAKECIEGTMDFREIKKIRRYIVMD